MSLLVFALLFSLSQRTFAVEWNLELNQVLSSRASSELTNPRAIFPSLSSMSSLTLSLLKAESTCFKDDEATLNAAKQQSQTDPSAIKLLQWILFHCKMTESLPSNFFLTPPYMYPLGDSWVLKAYQSRHKEYSSKDWLNSMLDKTHLLELSIFNSEVELKGLNKLYSELTPDQLDQFIRGESLIQTEYFTLKRKTNTNPITYSIYKNELNTFLNSSFFIYSLGSILIVLIGIIIWLALRLITARRQFWKDRELMMQTLAHELRHPVTSLQLSLEVYRNIYDSIPNEAQVEFLRMSGQIQRLNRIIHASGQYLRTNYNPDIPFQFKPHQIESSHDYLNEVLKEYLPRIELTILNKDISFYADPYWLSVCITNLIKNALIHGKPPVQVKVEIKDHLFMAEILDQGHLDIKLDELGTPFLKSEGSQGMGLGLTIVSRIIQMMGGKLSCQLNPTRFQFSIKEFNNEKTLAS